MTASEDWPRYFLFGIRPVKAFKTASGSVDIEAYQWDTVKFERDIELGTQVFMGGEDVDRVTVEQFDAQVKTLRAKLKKSS